MIDQADRHKTVGCLLLHAVGMLICLLSLSNTTMVIQPGCRDAVEWMREREAGGATCVLVAHAHTLAAAFAITDPLKPEAVGVVAALRQLGLQVLLSPGLAACCWHLRLSSCAICQTEPPCNVLPAQSSSLCSNFRMLQRTACSLMVKWVRAGTDAGKCTSHAR